MAEGWIRRKKRIKTKAGYLTSGISNWTPKGTGDTELLRGGGSGGLGRQTNACDCSGTALGEGARSHGGSLWSGARKDAGDPHHPALDGLQNPPESSHNQGGRPTPHPTLYSWLSALGTGETPQHGSWRPRRRPARAAFPRHSTRVESIICGTQEMITA